MRISDWSSDVCSSDLLWRERFVDASLPGMSVDCGPDSLARLGIFRKAMPIRADTAVHPLIARPQDGLILAPSPMRDHAGTAILYIDEMLVRSEEHTSELQSLMRISYAVFCLKTK